LVSSLYSGLILLFGILIVPLLSSLCFSFFIIMLMFVIFDLEIVMFLGILISEIRRDRN
uniref:SSD domain-containing protein n=1 Tax=Haemonchus placei TaxID=6290 RepID=A0A0N4WHR7_HAEPC